MENSAFNLVALNLDWDEFLKLHDLIWTQLPRSWDEGPFIGDGEQGAILYSEDDANCLHWHLGNSLATYETMRIPIGRFTMKPLGEIESFNCRKHLFKAEVIGEVKTTQGQINFRTYAHATDEVIIIDVTTEGSESGVQLSFRADKVINGKKLSLKIRGLSDESEDDGHPPPHTFQEEGSEVCLQNLLDGTSFATVWRKESLNENTTRYFIHVQSSQSDKAHLKAIETVNRASKVDNETLDAGHHAWWAEFYPKSFVSIPDAKLESYYWIQLYKLASATREEKHTIDLMGPWFKMSPWLRIWWNLNIQLTYWPMMGANHLELATPLFRMLDENKETLGKNAGIPENPQNYAFIGRTSGYNCDSDWKLEWGDLTWVLHNYWLYYRHSMDDQTLKEKLFPLLKRAINFYHYHIEEDEAGVLHLPPTHSPEYGGPQRTKTRDCNYDLSLLRWGCQTLLQINEHLSLDDPLATTWQDILDRLTDYPVDETGLRIGRDVALEKSHRHYSHLLMFYPLQIMNWEQPEHRDLLSRSFEHWIGLEGAHQGYSYTGSASMTACMRDGNRALDYLHTYLEKHGLPNTLYREAGPVIETPLSAAQSILDMLIQSWGNVLRIFPAVADVWEDLAFHQLRAEGAFLISAKREKGETALIQITSLAGESCVLETDMIDPVWKASREGITVTSVEKNRYAINLQANDTIIIYPRGRELPTELGAVEIDPSKHNPFGVK